MLLEDLPFIWYKENSFVKKEIKEKNIQQFFADVKIEKFKSCWQFRRQLLTADVN